MSKTSLFLVIFVTVGSLSVLIHETCHIIFKYHMLFVKIKIIQIGGFYSRVQQSMAET